MPEKSAKRVSQMGHLYFSRVLCIHKTNPLILLHRLCIKFQREIVENSKLQLMQLFFVTFCTEYLFQSYINFIVQLHEIHLKHLSIPVALSIPLKVPSTDERTPQVENFPSLRFMQWATQSLGIVDFFSPSLRVFSPSYFKVNTSPGFAFPRGKMAR